MQFAWSLVYSKHLIKGELLLFPLICMLLRKASHPQTPTKPNVDSLATAIRLGTISANLIMTFTYLSPSLQEAQEAQDVLNALGFNARGPLEILFSDSITQPSRLLWPLVFVIDDQKIVLWPQSLL